MLIIHFLEPFVVAFVETMYTVSEGVGAAVSVCVNLTEPQLDVLDETVGVFLVQSYSSAYIPASAPLASEQHILFLQL